jgi:hypothetical protein
MAKMGTGSRIPIKPAALILLFARHGRALPAHAAEPDQHAAEAAQADKPEIERAARVKGASPQAEAAIVAPSTFLGPRAVAIFDIDKIVVCDTFAMKIGSSGALRYRSGREPGSLERG